MPLEKQTFDIELRGLSQHDDDRKTIPGTLTRADNVEIVKAGALTIRRGYRRIHTERAVGDIAVRTAGDQLFHRVCVYRGTIVVFGHSLLFEVASRQSAIVVSSGTTGIVSRGRLGRSGIRSRVIMTTDRSTGQGGSAAGPGT